jgi:MFS family permease
VKRSFVSAGAESSPQYRHVRARHVAAVVAGNALEFYDFVTYGYFAIYIGRTFFPDIGQHSSLLLSLATFGVGFLTRPLGAIVIGRMGDRIGRKPAMILSFTLMGISLIGLALTPSYAKLGIAAPILVIFFRLAQGFALGGEVGPTTAYLVEAAPPHRRGFYASLSFMTQDASALCAGLVGVALSSALTEQQLQDWGWRAAMLIGAIIVPFGLWMRRALPETIDTDEDGTVASDKSASRSRTDLQPYVRVIVLGLFLLMSATIGNYVLSYMTHLRHRHAQDGAGDRLRRSRRQRRPPRRPRADWRMALRPFRPKAGHAGAGHSAFPRTHASPSCSMARSAYFRSCSRLPIRRPSS